MSIRHILTQLRKFSFLENLQQHFSALISHLAAEYKRGYICTIGTGSFPGLKRPGRGVDHPHPSSAEVEGRVELYRYFPSGPSWPVNRATFTFTFIYIYIYVCESITIRNTDANFISIKVQNLQ